MTLRILNWIGLACGVIAVLLTIFAYATGRISVLSPVAAVVGVLAIGLNVYFLRSGNAKKDLA